VNYACAQTNSTTSLQVTHDQMEALRKVNAEHLRKNQELQRQLQAVGYVVIFLFPADGVVPGRIARPDNSFAGPTMTSASLISRIASKRCTMSSPSRRRRKRTCESRRRHRTSNSPRSKQSYRTCRGAWNLPRRRK
jgi:hypothetical protein